MIRAAYIAALFMLAGCSSRPPPQRAQQSPTPKFGSCTRITRSGGLDLWLKAPPDPGEPKAWKMPWIDPIGDLGEKQTSGTFSIPFTLSVDSESSINSFVVTDVSFNLSQKLRMKRRIPDEEKNREGALSFEWREKW